MKTNGNSERERARVLIVEDSMTQRELLRHILQEQGFEVQPAAGAAEALLALEHFSAAIVITDIIMPQMDGFELCRRIKALDNFRNTPVILLTALSDPHDIIRGLACGADHFIVKPYQKQTLVNRIEYMLSNRRLHEREREGAGVEITFAGQRHLITSERRQILDLLLSIYEAAMQKNEELEKARQQLKAVNTELEQRVRERTSRLQEVNQSLESFCYTIAHDLRSPLRAIQGYTAILLDRYGRHYDEEARADARRVMDAARQMDQLIRDLLAYGQISQADIPIGNVSLDDEVERAVSPLHAEMRQRKAEVRVRRPLPLVRGNASVLAQVFANLFSNALKFAKESEPPRIDIWAESSEPHRVRLNFEDNGIGIDPAHLQRIFGLFQRLHDTQKYPGTGIGLVIVQKGVQRMGGSVGVRSEPGRGSCFWIELPAAA